MIELTLKAGMGKHRILLSFNKGVFAVVITLERGVGNHRNLVIFNGGVVVSFSLEVGMGKDLFGRRSIFRENPQEIEQKRNGSWVRRWHRCLQPIRGDDGGGGDVVGLSPLAVAVRGDNAVSCRPVAGTGGWHRTRATAKHVLDEGELLRLVPPPKEGTTPVQFRRDAPHGKHVDRFGVRRTPPTVVRSGP